MYTCAPFQRDRTMLSASSTPSSQPANAAQRYEVSRADLPLSCPMPGMTLWNSHPKVFLPLEASGEARCPYCGAIYVLNG
jgi:uncharacterized Zn-finger protein